MNNKNNNNIKRKLKKFTKHCNSAGNLCGSEEMNRNAKLDSVK